MADKRRFNVWAAYIDLFSNLLVFIMMVGLIAAAAGTAGRSTTGACAKTAAYPDLDQKLATLENVLHLDQSDAEPEANCEISTIPKKPPADWALSTDFLQFHEGTDDFCWDTSRKYRPDGCTSQASSPNDLGRFCDAVGGVIEAVEKINRHKRATGIRVVFVGHTSEKWQTSDLKPCEKLAANEDNSSDETSQDQAMLICNYKLSLARAHRALAECEYKWRAEKLPIDNRKDLMNVLSEQGEASLDGRLIDAMPAADNTSQGDDPRLRRVTVSVYVPQQTQQP